MVNKDSFAKWLEEHSNIKPYTIGRYASAIDTITSELSSYGLPQQNLFSITDTVFIDSILTSHEFIQKNNKGNRMYSTALKHYKRYLDYVNGKDYLNELTKEEREFEQYLKDSDISRELAIIDQIRERPDYKAIGNYKVWRRNPKLAKDAVILANYLCDFDKQHHHFVSKYNQQNYVEAHHLIPLEFQEEYHCSLDIHANIVSLCLVCHKKIHYGYFEDKKEILDKLFNDRKDRLRACGLEIPLNKLYTYYKD